MEHGIYKLRYYKLTSSNPPLIIIPNQSTFIRTISGSFEHKKSNRSETHDGNDPIVVSPNIVCHFVPSNEFEMFTKIPLLFGEGLENTL